MLLIVVKRQDSNFVFPKDHFSQKCKTFLERNSGTITRATAVTADSLNIFSSVVYKKKYCDRLTFSCFIAPLFCLCQSSALDLKTKEEKDAELDKRIEALRKKNEALVKRYQVWGVKFLIKINVPLN